MRTLNPDNYGDGKMDKSTELNSEMTIQANQPDEFASAVKTKTN